MKHFRHLLTALLMLCTTTVLAYDFKVDGIYYDFIDQSEKTVCVARGNYYVSGDIIIPSYVTYENEKYRVKELSWNAFTGSNITSVTISEGVEIIGQNAFRQCDNLISVTLPTSLTKIAVGAFEWCGSLTSITLPEGLTIIEDVAFCNCDNLTTITLPKTLTEIKLWAFYNTPITTVISHIPADKLTDDNSYSAPIAQTLYVPYKATGSYERHGWVSEDYTEVIEMPNENPDLNRPKIVINMTDRNGDGWDTNAIVIKKNGDEIGTATFEYGENSCATFEYDKSSDYSFYWLQGCNPEECSFEILIEDDIIYSATEDNCRRFEDQQLLYMSIGGPKIAIKMRNDTWGYEGNFSAIKVLRNGEEIGIATFPSACPTTIAEFKYDYLSEYSFIWLDGDYSWLCPFEIFIDGEMVFTESWPFLSDNQQFFNWNAKEHHILIDMQATYSDGWNGSAIVVMKDEEEIGRATIEEGKIGMEAFPFDPKSVYTFHWDAGTYPEECSFDIYTGGNKIFSSSQTSDDLYYDGEQLTTWNEERMIFLLMEGYTWDSEYSNSIVVKKNGEYIGEVGLGDNGKGTGAFYFDNSSEYTFYWKEGEASTEYSLNISIGNNDIFTAYYEDCEAYLDGQLLLKLDNNNIMSIDMEDTAGDSWEDNHIIVEKNGVKIGEASLSKNRYYGCSIFMYDNSAEYKFYWGKGNQPYHCAFSINIHGQYVFNANLLDCDAFYDMQLIYTHNAEKITIADGATTNYSVEDDKKVFALTYSRTLPNTEWNALYLPFKVPVEMLTDNYDVAYFNNMHAYDRDNNGQIDEMDMEIMLLNEGTLHANHPYFIRAKNDAAKELNIEVTDATLYTTQENSLTCSSVYLNYELKGIYTQRTAAELTDCYAINTSGAWSPIATGSYLNPFRLYLKITSRDGSPVEVASSALQSIRIRLKGDYTTDIDEVETQATDATIIYDLSGRRVENPGKGIYIVNGKKVVLK